MREALPEKRIIITKKVFVGNLNFRTTKEELEGLFAQVGQLADVFLPVDRDTGRPRGFAFVEFAEESDAEAAIERFNGHELGGRPLRVNSAEEKPRREPSFGGGGGAGGNRYSGGGGGYGGGGGGGDDRGGGGRPKGSRRNIRAKKRSL